MSDRLNKIVSSLFDVQDVALTPKEHEIKIRYMDLYTQMLQNPWRSDSKLVTYMGETYGLSVTQSYHDISAVKMILGNVRNAGKEFQRYAAIEMLKEATLLLSDESTTSLDIKRAEAKIKAAKALAYVCRLDKDEAEVIPWDEIMPQSFEVTGDVSVLGLKKIPNLAERQAKLRKELFGDIKIQDAQYVDE